jgi:hypothetical protein
LSACAAGQEVTREEISNNFEREVFIPLPTLSDKILLKWQSPIVVAMLSGDGLDPDLFNSFAANLAKIAQATGHPIKIGTEHVNFLIVISSDPDRDLHGHDGQLNFFSSRTLDIGRSSPNITKRNLAAMEGLF